MSFIEVFFNSSLQATIEISDQPISIGRAAHNQIQINNKGVSLIHAVITKTDNDWFIEDLNSTNGTFLNGVKVDGKQLFKFGDILNICKHDLKFVAARTHVAPVKNIAQNEEEDADRTIMLRGSKTEKTSGPERTEVSPQKSTKHNCYLLVNGEQRNVNKLLLNRESFSIGKGKDNDLQVGGWFTPKKIAELILLGESYYISPIAKKLVKINGRNAESSVKLSNDDNIVIKKLSLKFVKE